MKHLYDRIWEVAEILEDHWPEIVAERQLAKSKDGEVIDPPVLIGSGYLDAEDPRFGQPRLVLDVQTSGAQKASAFDAFVHHLRRSPAIRAHGAAWQEYEPGCLRIWMTFAPLPKVIRRSSVPMDLDQHHVEIGQSARGREVLDLRFSPNLGIFGRMGMGKTELMVNIGRQVHAHGGWGVIVAPKSEEDHDWSPGYGHPFRLAGEPLRQWPVLWDDPADPDDAKYLDALELLLAEMGRRQALCKAAGVKNLAQLDPRQAAEIAPRCLLVLDDIGELLGDHSHLSDADKRELSQGIRRLIRFGRAYDMGALLASQVLYVSEVTDKTLPQLVQARFAFGPVSKSQRELIFHDRAEDADALWDGSGVGSCAAMDFNPARGTDVVRIRATLIR